jgi:beta-glucanase (GH16 family)
VVCQSQYNNENFPRSGCRISEHVPSLSPCIFFLTCSLLSDVKDEIDYEFVGKDLSTAQTNIYWQALPYYGNSANITNLTDTFTNFHTYVIDWQQDQIIWSVDGVVGRTKSRSSTWNTTSQLYNYPQTPSRVQVSIWPGGASDQAAGTIAWAGGPINWDSPDIQSAGYYYMEVSQVVVECYPAPPGAPTQGNGSVSYVYDDTTTTFLNNSVIRICPLVNAHD